MVTDVDELVYRIVNDSDEYAFEILVEDYKNLVYFVARKYVKDTDDIKDIVQDVFLKVWNKIGLYDFSVAPFNVWLTEITKNTCFNYLRKKKQEEKLIEELGMDITIKEDAKANDNLFDVFEEYSISFKKVDLMKILTQHEYEVIVMKYKLKLCDKDICDCFLTLSKRKVKENIKSAEKKLIEWIRENYGDV